MKPLFCPRLPKFDTHNWAEIETVFASVPRADLVQHWLEAPEAHFLPANARFGWQDRELYLFAVLHDRDIFNAAKGFNQQTWMLGDALELFLRPPSGETYFEFHVTPENQRLQLRFPDSRAVRTGTWTDFQVNVPLLFDSRTEINAPAETWRALLSIDLTALGGGQFSPAHPWKFSVSRYDWTRGQSEPIISSTSPHQHPRFHRQHEWGELVFEEI